MSVYIAWVMGVDIASQGIEEAEGYGVSAVVEMKSRAAHQLC
ncbi:MAG: hypothetical protein O4804_05015 [Trichodesmium sp. St11_bin5]|nr:hypothetical protein [Trichodesmium sp. St11_bin5]MDT9341315.1 hypothetical protein [Trichodesmium erythraeum 21-75]